MLKDEGGPPTQSKSMLAIGFPAKVGTTKLWNKILKRTDQNKAPTSVLSRKRRMNFIINFLLQKSMTKTAKSAKTEINFDVSFMDDYEHITKEILQFLKDVCCTEFVCPRSIEFSFCVGNYESSMKACL